MTTKTRKTAENATEVLSGIAADASKPMIQVARTEPGAPLEPSVSAFKPQLNPQRPSAEWSLDELGDFARKTLRKSAEVSWELGRALVLAKEKASRKFNKWAKDFVPELSARTRTRYMAVGRLDYDDVKGKSVSDIYTLLWGESHTGRQTTPAKKATVNIKALTKLLEGHADEVMKANRESLVALHATLTKLLVG